MSKTFPVWREVFLGETIVHGVRTNARMQDSYLARMASEGNVIAPIAHEMLKQIDYANQRVRVQLARVRLSDLWSDMPYAMPEYAHAAGLAQGLLLCPPEAALALRLAYQDQPDFESLSMAMTPIAVKDGKRRDTGNHVRATFKIKNTCHGTPSAKSPPRLRLAYEATRTDLWPEYEMLFMIGMQSA